MKYEVIAKSPFYCTVLQRAFTKGQTVQIEDIKRANELVDAKLLSIVEVKKKSTRKKVDKHV